KNYASLTNFLIQRVQYFDEVGCKSADHGFGEFLYKPATLEEIDAIYEKGKQGINLTRSEIAKWQGQVMSDLGREYEKLGWVMQIHFGAIRNANSRMYQQLGKDVGCDSIIDQSDVAKNLNGFLDALDKTNQLPKTIIYNLNPVLNDLVATTCANFQSNNKKVKNKVQFGAAWWFNDQYDGMIKQMETLSNQGILMHFIGMLTDSRSFISYSRHEYFRRILCEFIGQKVCCGYYPNEPETLEKLVEKICFENANEFFELFV
ncbi:MAG: glucuronate isomerase, partial [Paracoccus sp. (in: a-proteobacteria)]